MNPYKSNNTSMVAVCFDERFIKEQGFSVSCYIIVPRIFLKIKT